LAVLGGNANPTPADLTKIMASVGIDCDADNCKKVIEALKGKNIEQVIEEGKKKLASVPSGAGAAAPAAAAGGGGGGKPAAEAKKEEKKEEKKKEESEEEEGDMGFGLFD